MNALLVLIDSIVDIYIFTLLAYVIASWLIAFKIINPWQPFVRTILHALGALHEPVLSHIRKLRAVLAWVRYQPYYCVVSCSVSPQSFV